MNKFWNWLFGIEHDVEAILADLSGTVKRLEARAAKRLEDVAKHADEARTAQQNMDGAKYEAERAKAVADKIGALLS